MPIIVKWSEVPIFKIADYAHLGLFGLHSKWRRRLVIRHSRRVGTKLSIEIPASRISIFKVGGNYRQTFHILHMMEFSAVAPPSLKKGGYYFGQLVLRKKAASIVKHFHLRPSCSTSSFKGRGFNCSMYNTSFNN